MVAMAVPLHLLLLLVHFLIPTITTTITITIIITTTMPPYLLLFHQNLQPIEVLLQPEKVCLHPWTVHLYRLKVRLPLRKAMRLSHLFADLDTGPKGKRESGLEWLLQVRHQNTQFILTTQLHRHASK